MLLNLKQTRNLLLAGTIPFPTPFPASGVIQLTDGDLRVSRDGKIRRTPLVISRHSYDDRAESRLMQQSDVAGIFVPGKKDEHGVFQISQAPCVDDFEEGEWFLAEDVNAAEVRARLKLKDEVDIATPASVLRGIVFVPEDRGTIYAFDVALRAGDSHECTESPCCRGCCRP